MGKPSAPTPPDPQVTAGAQTAQNVTTAIANNTMGNVNQVTPYGNLTYETTGTQQFTDPNTGDVYDIPQYTATTSLSGDQQQILDSSNQAQINMAQLGADQSQRLNDLLSSPLDISGLPDRQTYDPSREPAMARVGSGPNLSQVSSPNTPMQTSYDMGGQVQTGVETQSDFIRGVQGGPIQTGLNATGAQNGQLADAGQVATGLNLSGVGAVNRNVDIPQISGIPQITAGGAGGINYNRSDLGQVQQTFGDTPELNLDPNAPGYSSNTSAQGINFQQSQLGDVQTQLGQSGDIRTDAGLQGIRDTGGGTQLSFQQSQLGDVQRSLADAGAIYLKEPGQQAQTTFGDVGDVQRDANATSIRDVGEFGSSGVNYNRSDLGGAQQIGGVSDILRNIDPSRQIQFNAGDAGDITRSYSTDFSQDRQRVEDAINERMAPGLQKDREALEARLASQGIRIGSQPYQDAMADFNRQTNDARLGAIMAGGQEQSRLVDMEARRAGFQNAAQMQAFQQLQQEQASYNNAQAQEFGQNATQAQFSNAAQAQEFGQARDRAAFDASEQGRLAGQTLQQDAMDLQAQGMNADIQSRNGQLQLQRDIAANSADMDAARFANEGQAQAYSQARDRFDAFNQGVGQNFGQDLATVQQRNDAQAQDFGQILAGGQFANAAQDQAAQQAIQQDAQRLQAGQAQADIDARAAQLGVDRDIAAGNQQLQGAQFQNQAQLQQLQELLARGQFGNAAQDQAAQQAMQQDALRLQAGGMNADLAAQNDRLNLDRETQANRTALDSFAMGNDARNDAFGQALARGSFAQAGQAQQADQTLAQDQLDVNAQEASARLGLQGQANALQAQTANAQMALRAQEANQQAALDAARFGNDAQGQAFAQALASGNFQNDGQAQAFQQALASGQFGNDANTQELQNQIAAGTFANSGQALAFGQGMQNANLNNTSLASIFGQDLSAGNFANAAQAQQNSQNRDQAMFGNDARTQELQEALAMAGFNNGTQQQMFGNDITAINQGNAAGQQEFGNYMAGLDQGNQDRAAALQEQLAMRNQPINEISALLGGSQVTQPNFVNTSSAQMPTTDYAGIVSDNYKQQMQGYNAQMNQWNSIFGGLGGLGASAIMMSDRRLKRDIRRISEGTLPVYEYRYVWDAPGTVRRGYMAQEVLGLVPDAVVRVGKWLALNYSKLPEVA